LTLLDRGGGREGRREGGKKDGKEEGREVCMCIDIHVYIA